MAYGLAVASPVVAVEIVDWELFRKLGGEYRVSAVPKTFINHGNPFTGTESERSIFERVLREQ